MFQCFFAKINNSNLQKNTDTFIRFIDKANSIDTNKIKSIRDMFEQVKLIDSGMTELKKVTNETEDTYNSEFILSLNKQLASSKNTTFTTNCGDSQYIYFAIPSRFGTPTFSVGGFVGGFVKAATIDFPNYSGYTEKYDIYRSNNPSLGNKTVTVG